MKLRLLPLLLAVGVLLAFTGCDAIYREHAESLSRVGDAKSAAGDYHGAIDAYEAALDGTTDVAMVHYKIGVIYDEHLDEPISALHHFQRYLALAPDGSRRVDVENYIKEDQLKLLTRLGSGALVPQSEAVRLKNENQSLRKQVLELRAEAETASKERANLLKSLGIKDDRLPGTAQVKKPLVPGVRTYVVQKGDTLASIARKFYKNPANWKRIQEANFAPMQGTAKLQIGMELMIP